MDGDGVINDIEFTHMVRHMLRSMGERHGMDIATRISTQVAAILPVKECVGLSLDCFLDLISSGALAKHGLHTGSLFQLASFRERVNATVLPQTDMVRSGILKRVAPAVAADLAPRKKVVRVCPGHNEVPVPPEGKGLKLPRK